MSNSAQQAQGQGQGQQINLSTLPVQQLSALKTQITQDLTHLTSSFQQLKTAQAKFRDCDNSIVSAFPISPSSSSASTPTPTQILVPLTPSLYVPGHLADSKTVLVDIGTGFYVEKTPAQAREFYKRKVQELGSNCADLEKIVGGKQGNLSVVEDVLRQKMMLENNKAGAEEES